MKGEVSNSMFAVDTNLLVYAHNADSAFHEPAKQFIGNALNSRDDSGRFQVCIHRDTGVIILHPKTSQLDTLLTLFESVTTRKKVFDIALAATLKDNGIEGLYTVNTKDFVGFDFLDVVNPLS